MKIGYFNMTSGLSVVCISVLLVLAFADEVSAKPPPTKKSGCQAYGHSCFGGHGKRSMPDDANDRINNEIDRESPNLSEDIQEPNDDRVRRVLNNDEIQQVQDFIACRNRAIEASRRSRVQRNPLPELIQKWINSQRRFNDDLETNDK